MKLIKLSEEHYIVVDDSEIKEGDWYYDTNDKESLMPIYQRSQDPKFYSGCKKITHSTNIDWHEVYYIPLSEVKELVGVVDVEKKADEEYYEQDKSFENDIDPFLNYSEYLKVGFIDGYNQALEDNKEKKYTEKDMQWALHEARYHQQHTIEEIIEALHQPQTEWEVEIVDGKLKLKQ